MPFLTITICQGQNKSFIKEIDSYLAKDTAQPFNGVILISDNGKIKYSKYTGFANRENKEHLTNSHQFVIGSISKQITAVLVLQQYELGHLQLNVPIKAYLKDLDRPWADTVTIHHLLTHTHGIVNVDKPLSFTPGSQFSYSQIGYELLAKIVESTSKKTFAELSTDLFKQCKMSSSFHPAMAKHKNLVTAYTKQNDGRIEVETESFENFVAAGSFISSAEDLITWNQHFYGGKLLQGSTMQLLTTKQKNAVREHPIFGITEYGYGITVDTKDNILQYGQTGFAPGFVSMNFYYPETKTSLVILENIVYDMYDFNNTFRHLTEVQKIVRERKIAKKRE